MNKMISKSYFCFTFMLKDVNLDLITNNVQVKK
jgi:hypothetical protein